MRKKGLDYIKATAVQRGEWHDPEAAKHLFDMLKDKADVLLNSRMLSERLQSGKQPARKCQS